MRWTKARLQLLTPALLCWRRLRRTPCDVLLRPRSLAMVGAVILNLASATASGADTAFDLLRTLERHEAGKNVVLSPFSIDLALSLLAEGASGTTQRQIRTLVGDAATSLARLRAAREAGASIDFGSCLWAPPQLDFSPGFARRAESDFAAIVIKSDARDAPALVNDWIRKTTRGVIRTILDEPPDPSGVVLSNGLAFFGKWAEPFDPTATKPAPFRSFDGAVRNVPMMVRTGEFNYASTPAGQLIELPYADDKFTLSIFLPGQAQGLAKWLDEIDLNTWNALKRSLRASTGEMNLPRMNLALSLDVSSALRELGMTEAFQQGVADFSAMTVSKEPLFVSRILHRTAIMVDETGTVAAASTTIHMPGAAPPSFRMVVDHPFVFAITETSGGDLLFLGIVGSL